MKWSLIPAADFSLMANRWRELHARCQASPMLAVEFVQPLLAAFGDGEQWLACCEDGGVTVAMALVTPSGRASWATFQPAQAPVGLWLQQSGIDVQPLVEALLPDLPRMALVFGLTQMDPDLLARPQGLRTLDYIATAKISLAGSFDDYWAARGKNLRNNLKKQRARLEKEGVAPRLQISRDCGEVAAAVADYGRLESAGWKAGGGTAVDAGNAQGQFYRAMLEGFCRRGAGSIYRYWFNERIVAMDLCIEDERQIIVLKTTYDESVPSNLSPTLLMREQALRQLFDEQRFERLEFYGKVMEWHTRWTDEVRILYHVNHYRWPALGRLHALWQSRRARHLKEDHVP